MTTATIPTLLTKKQFCEKHPAFTVPGLDWMFFHRESNGLRESGAVIKLGRRVLIDENRFFAWLDTQREGPGK